MKLNIKKSINFPCIVFIISFVNILWGYQTIGVTPHIESYFNAVGASQFSNDFGLLSQMHNIAKFSFYLSIISAVAFGFLTDFIGRKPTLQLSNLLFLVAISTFLITKSTTLDVYCMAIMTAASSGIIISSVCLMVEIAPYEIRGRCMGLIKFFGMIGLMLSYFFNYFIPFIFKTEVSMRFHILLILSIINVFLLLLVPRSPRWLSQVKGDKNRASQILQKIFSTSVSNSAEQQYIISSPKQTWCSSISLFKKPILSTSIMICIITILLMATGASYFLTQAPDIFRKSGITSQAESLQLSMLLVFFYGMGIFISLFLIDKIGKRNLVIFSLSSMIISYLLLSIASNLSLGNTLQYFVLIARPFIFVFFYSLGCTVVFTLVLTIYFPTILRARAVAMSSLIVLLFGSFVRDLLDLIEHSLKLNGIYWFCALVALLLLLICLEILPETKHTILEQETLF